MPSLSSDLIDLIDHGNFSQALIYLHPGMGAKETWGRFPRLLCNELKTSGIVYTRPEYEDRDGQISLPTDFIEREADRLEALLAENGVKSALVVGSSDGASIALEHAGRHPKRVGCIVSIAAHVIVDPVMIEALDRLRREARSEPTPQWLISQFGANGVATALAWCKTWKVLMTSGWSMEERLSTITCPVLAMQGTEDRNGNLHQLDAIAAKIPDCKVSVLQGLGHFPFRQEPERLCNQVAAYLKVHMS